MKRILLSLVLALTTIGLSGQTLSSTDDQAIEKRTESFLELIKARKYSNVADYIYPPLFDHTDKKGMFQVFNMLEQAGIKLNFNELNITDKKLLPSDNDVKYVFIKYAMDMTLPLDTDDLKGIAALLVPAIESSFGKENVDYNKAESFVNVKGEKFLLAIEDPKFSDWMFIIYDDSFKSAIQKTIPAKVNQAAASMSK
ncbi:hypothetical protein [Roseivirga misakiensis]|uniref:DUF1254 domain-containing protein n=1 Tax=Roseivirga misakiensis TaxID=1563681 RepID=A0A1E5T5C6_9BACT|nr:hypothetical protein [Roseivirga misakiensis]OEK06582.1 hypothetical protein BFP71_02620 [Roseivirga misakiensis]